MLKFCNAPVDKLQKDGGDVKDISADHSANDKATEKVCVRELGASSQEYRGSACLSNTIWITGTLSSQINNVRKGRNIPLCSQSFAGVTRSC